jgi:hypothetical protein
VYSKGEGNIMANTQKRVTQFFLIGIFSVILILGSAYKVQAAQSDDPNSWERIPREGYADPAQFGNYMYYFTNKVNSGKYKIYRQDIETGKSECVLTFNKKTTYGIGCTFYTNGEKLVFEDSNLVYCTNADGTGSQKKILDLRKKDNDLAGISLYGDRLYYSTYHIYDVNYKSYSIKINGKSKKVISKSYAVNGFSDRYITMTNAKGGMAVYDAATGKTGTLYKSGEGYIERIGDYWYYIVCKNPKAKTQKITLYRKSASGKGSAKKLAEFSQKNVTVSNAMEISEEGIYFSYTMDEVKFYSLKDKKFKKTDRDVWYYVAKNMTYT